MEPYKFCNPGRPLQAAILADQFQSVFTTVKYNILPDLSYKHLFFPRETTVDSKGVEKLLMNLKISKAVGPDNIPNTVLKDVCMTNLLLQYSVVFTVESL